MADRVRLRDRERRYECPHCSQLLTLKTFRKHKRLYWCSERGWIREQSLSDSKTDSEPDEIPPALPVNLYNDATVQVDVATEPEHNPDSSESSDNDEVDEIDEEVWSEEEQEVLEEVQNFDIIPPSKGEETAHDQTPAPSLAFWLILFLVRLQANFHLSDGVVKAMLLFFKVFFTVLGRFNAVCAIIAKSLPSSLHRLMVTLGLKEKSFTRYVVCKKCHKIYFYKDCFEVLAGRQVSRKCSHIPFPQHPHHRMRAACGTPLLKSVELAAPNSVRIQYPFLTYCYLTLECSLQSLLLIPGLGLACEQWRSASRNGTDFLEDVYDGQIWKDFQQWNGQPFLSLPNCYGLMMNIDWFQPYKHVTYSVGVIYLSIMNLPRQLRYKWQNVLIIGIIPGPHEPPHDINSYLDPLVKELISFWHGIQLDVYGSGKKLVRCALLCCACDLPAGRKVCGFLSYNARFGCSRCKKPFSGSVGEMDFSGFDRAYWPLRTGDSHRKDAESLRSCKTKSNRDEQQSKLGCRYSVLLQLSYFNAPRMLVIDPMHNLFLGTAKHFVKKWLDDCTIPTSKYVVIQDRIDRTTAPSGIGRIPHKIQSGFSSFTADQFKNWVMYYSIIALWDLLPPEELECWRHFVLASRILCGRRLTRQDIQIADALLIHFCKHTERLYGNNIITPNMHMHCHLKECILDYGPIHGFWLFAFERFNGLLGLTPNNNRSIEIQLMSRFIKDSTVVSIQPPEEFSADFTSVLPDSLHCVGSLLETTQPILSESTQWGYTCLWSDVSLPNHYSRGLFQPAEVDGLKLLYSKLYSVPDSALELPAIHSRYSTLKLNGYEFGSYTSRSSSSSTVIAYWYHQLVNNSSSDGVDDPEERPARINYFAQHIITVNGTAHCVLLFSASWFKLHPCKHRCGKPITVWEDDLFELLDSYSIIPVHFIKSRAVSLVDKVDGLSALFVCPCVDLC